jgi:hypothetical protein
MRVDHAIGEDNRAHAKAGREAACEAETDQALGAGADEFAGRNRGAIRSGAGNAHGGPIRCGETGEAVTLGRQPGDDTDYRHRQSLKP